MVKHNIQTGVSLMSTLLLVTIVVSVAAAMAGMFTLNISLTNRVSNGSVALSEAEAGLAEVLYQISLEDNIEGTGNEENPLVNWGLNGETIRATITPGMNPDEAYHVVTFDPRHGFPYSTNNTNLTNDTGYQGRVVPDGMFHVISTGYCKGQYRTIECVIEKPPFPFGLATSGKIDSADPIRVLGTSSQSGYHAGETDRPGHILCNSPEGVTIRADEHGLTSTEISGFVKSVGPVTIEQPAVVRGGVQSLAEATTLTDIDIQRFKLGSEEQGVITLLDDDYHKDQELDVMYSYSRGGTLRYHGDVELHQAMIWVEGNLVIDGALTGEGLVIVTGNVDINDGANLNGTDKMALLAGGDIDIGRDGGNPEANYFSGLVYTEGNLTAKNITIVGNAVVNSQNPDKGHAILENVTFVSNEETGDMTTVITTSKEAKGGYDGGDGVGAPPVGDMGFSSGAEIIGDFKQNDLGYVDSSRINERDNHIAAMKRDIWARAEAGAGFPSLEIPPGLNPDAANLWNQLAEILEIAEAYHDAVKALQDQQKLVDSLSNTDPRKPIEVAKLAPLTKAMNDAQSTQQDFESTIEGYVDSVYDYVGAYTDDKGSFNDGIHELDITKEIRFNLNEYLPQSDRIKMSFWKVYPRRM